jgi:SET domain-containing protein
MKKYNKHSKAYKFKVENSRLGKGCFSTEFIKNGEFICFCQGKEVSWNEQERRYLEGKDRLDDPLQMSETEYIELDRPYIYFNHSCNPNSGIRGKNELIAIKNINPGDEIVYDYSTVTWDDLWVKTHGSWTMNCACNEKNCRKIIGDFLTIPESRRREYIMLGIVPDFILRKLNGNKMEAKV